MEARKKRKKGKIEPRAMVAVRLLALLSTLIALAIAGGAPPVVQTSSGYLEGIAADGAKQFLGVPYARAPLGSLRWKV